MSPYPRTAVAVIVTVVAALLFGPASVPAAHAHPLGNFSLNRHDSLRLSDHGIEDTVVVDSAEIPTAQGREEADTDGDGTVSRAEAASRARQRCGRLAGAARVTVDGQRGDLRVRSGRIVYGEGTAGLPTARLTCRLHSDADLSRPAAVAFTSGADKSRTGWKEITATAGNGVRLDASSVPARSASGGLRRYPEGAADEPLNLTTARLRSQPGAGGTAGVTDEAAPGGAPSPGVGASLFPGLERELTRLTNGRDLTLAMGVLGVLLTVLLGAGHAALPGHAKLAVAACLARRRGGVRAALAVGATVTATHTTGVLVVGLVLTLSGGLLGERLLVWLGAVSGLLIAAIGTGLVVTAVRTLKSGSSSTTWRHSHSHGHGHSHGHEHSRPYEDGRRSPLRLSSLLGVALAGGLVPSPSALVVLLGAIALSRTFFGVLLVLGYGIGMAATLTAAGLLLSGGGSRLSAVAERRLPAWSRCARYGTLLTALTVLTVGLGLTLRSLVPF